MFIAVLACAPIAGITKRRTQCRRDCSQEERNGQDQEHGRPGCIEEKRLKDVWGQGRMRCQVEKSQGSPGGDEHRGHGHKRAELPRSSKSILCSLGAALPVERTVYEQCAEQEEQWQYHEHDIEDRLLTAAKGQTEERG